MPNFVPIPRRINYGRPVTTRIGPWPKGLHTRFTPEVTETAQTLTTCDNFDILPNGELFGRPPFLALLNPVWGTATIGTPTGFDYRGSSWQLDLAYANGNALYGFSRKMGAGWCITNLTTGASITVKGCGVDTANGGLGKPAYYNGYIYAVVTVNASAANAGQIAKIDPIAGTVTYQTVAASLADTSTSRNWQTKIYKDRMYVWDPSGSRIYFSVTGDPFTFQGNPDAGFFDVVPNDGQTIKSIEIVHDTMYIFKSKKTLALTVPSTGVPTQGALRIVHPTVGALSPLSTAVWENYCYTFSDDGVYQIINGLFTRIDYVLGEFELAGSRGHTYSKVNGVAGADCINVIDDKLVIGTFSGPTATKPTVYVYNLRTNAWSTWSSQLDANHPLNPQWSNMMATTKVVPVLNAAAFNGDSPVPVYNQQLVSNNIDTKYLISDPWNSYNGSSNPGTIGIVYAIDTKFNCACYYDTDLLNNTAASSAAQSPTLAARSIKHSIHTSDIDGGTVETDSWKRYYAVNVNAAYRGNSTDMNGVLVPTMTMSFTDHNGDTVVDSTVNLPIVDSKNNPITSPHYWSVKEYTSLRARHIEYDVTIDSAFYGPISLYSLDVLSKVKQGEQSAQVGG